MKMSWAETESAFVSFSAELMRKNSTSLHSTNKSRWIRHILQHKGLIVTVLEGHTVGRNHRVRKRFEMLDELMGGVT